MNKSKNFSKQPIVNMVLKFLPSTIITRTAAKHQSYQYYKRFKTYDLLVMMIFSTLTGSSYLRKVGSILLVFEGKINSLGLTNFPKCSTQYDVNKKCSSNVFPDIYHAIYWQ